jgi:hypothetical protein
MFHEKTGVRKSRETVPLTGTSCIKSKTPLEYGQYLAGISVVWGHDLAGISTFFQDNILLDWPSTGKHLRIYVSSIQCSFKATRTEPSYVSPLTEFITVAANQLQTLSNRTAWFVRNSRTPWRLGISARCRVRSENTSELDVSNLSCFITFYDILFWNSFACSSSFFLVVRVWIHSVLITLLSHDVTLLSSNDIL